MGGLVEQYSQSGPQGLSVAIWELVQDVKFHAISENSTDCEDYNLYEKMIEQIRSSSSGNVSQTNNDTSDGTYKEAYNIPYALSRRR